MVQDSGDSSNSLWLLRVVSMLLLVLGVVYLCIAYFLLINVNWTKLAIVAFL